MRSTLAIALFLSIMSPHSVVASWSHDPGENNLICAAPDFQGSPELASLADGSTVISWVDERDGGFWSYDVYAQLLDVHGDERWAAGGTELWSEEWGVVHGGIIPGADDGLVFVARGGGNIVARWLDHSGEDHWPGSVDVATGARTAVAVGDGMGGAFVAFTCRESVVNDDVYVQRVSGNGELLWPAGAPGPGGVLLSDASYDENALEVISDGASGAVVLWEQFGDDDMAIRVQRVDAAGNALWNQGGVRVNLSPTSTDQTMVSDGAGGVIVVWEDTRGGGYDVYAQRVNASGHALWTAEGIPVSIAPDYQVDLEAVSDGEGGAIVVWSNWGGEAPDYYLHAQRIAPAGTLTWPEAGVILAPRGVNQFRPDLLEDGSGGAVAVWHEYNGQDDIAAQRIDGSGARLWGDEGVVVSSAPGDQRGVRLVGDGGGNAVAAWQDWRSGELEEPDVYAQRIDVHGYLGWPGANSPSAEDIPGDQGGEVVLHWEASYLDTCPEQVVTSYSVWMRGGGDEEWAHVAELDAACLQSYQCNAPTAGDSCAYGVPLTQYRVTAHTADASVLWESDFTGYSVDNLAPGSPPAPVAQAVNRDVFLVWSVASSHDEDVSGYSVYRGDRPGFVADGAALVSTTTDTCLLDADPGTGTWFYVVTARDVHGNESPPSAEISVEVAPEFHVLRASRPNPFSAATVIDYGIPRDAQVELRVFDVGGRLVKVLQDGPLIAGSKSVTWDGTDGRGAPVASGVYYCRLRAPGVEKRISMTLVR